MEDLKWLLVDLIMDLAAPAAMYREYRARPDFDPENNFYLGACRVCNSHTIIALWKFCEVLNKYGLELKDFPKDLMTEARSVKSTLEARGISKFRSKYVAHIHCDDIRAPLPITEAYAMLEDIIGKNLDDFYEWVSPEIGDGRRGIADIVCDLKSHCMSLIGSSAR